MSSTTVSADVAAEYAALLGADAEAYAEVRGGDFKPTWDFQEAPKLKGRYLRKEIREIKGEDRVFHVFDVDGTETDVWGKAILNSRLEGLEGLNVIVLSTGRKIRTSSGRTAVDFQVHVAKDALRKTRP